MHAHNAYAWACKQRYYTTFFANAFLTGPQGLARGGSSPLATDADPDKLNLYFANKDFNYFYDYLGFELYNYTYYY